MEGEIYSRQLRLTGSTSTHGPEEGLLFPMDLEILDMVVSMSMTHTDLGLNLLRSPQGGVEKTWGDA